MTSFTKPQNGNALFCEHKDLGAQTLSYNLLLITLILLTASNISFPQLLYKSHKLTPSFSLLSIKYCLVPIQLKPITKNITSQFIVDLYFTSGMSYSSKKSQFHPTQMRDFTLLPSNLNSISNTDILFS